MSAASSRTLAADLETLAFVNPRALHEFSAGKAFFVLELNFFEAQNSCAGSHPGAVRIGAENFAGSAVCRFRHYRRAMNLQNLATQLSKRRRPRIESTDAPPNNPGRLSPIDGAVFLLYDRRKCGGGVVLRLRHNGPGLQTFQGLHQ